MAHACEEFGFCLVGDLCFLRGPFGFRLRLFEFFFPVVEYRDVRVYTADARDDAICIENRKFGDIVDPDVAVPVHDLKRRC
mgnify:CR=1 FL=1